jgi:hypothetical protein
LEHHTSTPKFTRWEINWEDVAMMQTIGGNSPFGVVLPFGILLEGMFGSVHKAIWRGRIVAVKKLHSQEFSKKTMEDFCREAETMQ